jgi:hypothetical protein
VEKRDVEKESGNLLKLKVIFEIKVNVQMN